MEKEVGLEITLKARVLLKRKLSVTVKKTVPLSLTNFVLLMKFLPQDGFVLSAVEDIYKSKFVFKSYPTYFKKRTRARKYFNSLLKYLNLPKVTLYLRDENHSLDNERGIFKLNKNGQPYICLWKQGWDRATIKHEVIHYFQWLSEPNFWDSSEDDEGDMFEKEAYSLEELDEDSLKLYLEFRKTRLKEDSDGTHTSCEFSN